MSNQNVNIPSLIGLTQGMDNVARKQATATLDQLEMAHFPNYLLELCRILQDRAVSPAIRQGAGLLLKNAVTSSRGDLNEIRTRWTERLDDNTRHKIKQSMLSTLSVPNEMARNTAVIVISNLAVVETLERWKELIPTLLERASASNEAMSASLKCIAQIAESEYTLEELQPFSHKILELIAKVMSNAVNTSNAPNPQNLKVQTEAMNALNAIVELIEKNMQNPQQQSVILQMVCCGAKPGMDVQLRIASFMTMSRLVECYYSLMQKWMQQVFQISKQAIDCGVKTSANIEIGEVTKQAIEVWSTTAEIEADINEEMKEKNGQCERVNHNFVLKSLELLVPAYLKALLLQSDHFDPDEWTVRKAATCSLELFAHVVGDSMLKYVLQFVEQNIASTNWRCREAALNAFGCCLEGPSKAKLSGLVKQILTVVLKLMSDTQLQVTITAVWVLGRICAELPEAVNNPQILIPLVKALNGQKEMADKACWCIASLFQHHGSASFLYQGNNAKQMIQELLTRATKGDVTGTLVLSIHEALNTVITSSPSEDTQLSRLMATILLPQLAQQLYAVVEGFKRGDNTDTVQYRMAGLLSTIQVTLEKLGSLPSVSGPVLNQKLTDQLMECCCTVLQADHSLVYEEALGAVTFIGHSVGSNFMKYLMASQVQDLLVKAVRNGAANEDICRVGVGCIGDVYSACNEQICANPQPLQQYTDRIVSELLTLLINTNIGLSLKQHIIGALTDIMLAHGPQATRYSSDVLAKCLEIGVLRPPQNSDAEIWIDFNQIRAEICDVVRSCMLDITAAPNQNGNEQQQVAAQHILAINNFLEAVAADLQKADHEVLQKCILLLTDAALFCESNSALKNKLKTQSVQRILESAGKQQSDKKLAESAQGAFNALNR